MLRSGPMPKKSRCLARKGDRGDAHKETGRCLLQALMAACSRQKVLVSDGFIVAAPSEKLVGW